RRPLVTIHRLKDNGQDVSSGPLAAADEQVGEELAASGTRSPPHVHADRAWSSDRSALLDPCDAGGGRWATLARGSLWGGCVGPERPRFERGDAESWETACTGRPGRCRTRAGSYGLETLGDL